MLRVSVLLLAGDGARDRSRTCDLLLVSRPRTALTVAYAAHHPRGAAVLLWPLSYTGVQVVLPTGFEPALAA
jgi:hypothetical protein